MAIIAMSGRTKDPISRVVLPAARPPRAACVSSESLKSWSDKMPETVHIDVRPAKPSIARAPRPSRTVLWLQSVTLAWMTVEVGVSAYAAITAHSPAMLAFGSDSLVELLSATVVLLQWIRSEEH